MHGLLEPVIAHRVAESYVFTAVQAERPAVVITGGTRVGRSTVLRRVGDRIAAAGTTVLHGAGGPWTQGFTFAAIAHLLVDADPSATPDVVAALGAILHSVSGYFVLAVDDADLLDHATAAVLHGLVLSGRATAVLVTVEDVGAPAFVPAGLLDPRDVITLVPLDEPDVQTILEHRFGVPPDARTTRRITELSWGRPGMIAAVVEDAVDDARFDVDELVRLHPGTPHGPRTQALLRHWSADLDATDVAVLRDILADRWTARTSMDLATLSRLHRSGLVQVGANEPSGVRAHPLLEPQDEVRVALVPEPRRPPLLGGETHSLPGLTPPTDDEPPTGPAGLLDTVARLIAEGHLVAAHDAARAAVDTAASGDDQQILAVAQLLRGEAALLTGHLVVARSALKEAVSLGVDSPLVPRALVDLSQSAALCSDLETATRALERLRGSTPTDDRALDLANAWVALARRDPTACRSAAVRALDRPITAEDRDLAFRAVTLGVRLGLPEPVLHLATQLDDGRLLCSWFIAQARAVAAADAADLDRVAEQFAAAGARVLAAEAWASAALIHQRDGHRVAAHRSATRARAGLLDCAVTDPIALRNLSGIASLTRREEQVVWLAAGGATNKEIAASLGVSIRTVEGHLAHAFAALGLDRRGQLAELLTPSSAQSS